MTLKKLFTGITLLLVLMWLSGELLLRSDERALLREQAAIATTTPIATTVASSSRSHIPLVPNTKRAFAPLPERATSTLVQASSTLPAAHVASTSEELISVTITLDGGSFTHQLPKGASVATLLTAAQSAGELTFTGKEYSGLGMLVVGINGKENNQDKNNLYWIYSVNGAKAQKGVSQYQLTSGDSVSWSYEPNTY